MSLRSSHQIDHSVAAAATDMLMSLRSPRQTAVDVTPFLRTAARRGGSPQQSHTGDARRCGAGG